MGKKRKRKAKQGKAVVYRKQAEKQADKSKKEGLIARDAGFKRRMIALAILVAVVFLAFLVRIVQFQLGGGGASQPASSSGISQTSSLVQQQNSWV